MAKVYNVYRCYVCGWEIESTIMERKYCHSCDCNKPMGWCGTITKD